MKNTKTYTHEFYADVASRADITSQIVAEAVSKFLTIQTLTDVGCGSGIWTKNFLLKNNAINKAFTIDLPGTDREYLDSQSRDVYKVVNIDKDLTMDPSLPSGVVDLVICVEVLEHIQELSARELISEFGKKTKFLVFSAAIPGQGGTHHINEQKYSYWYKHLRKAGFIPLDIFRDLLKISEVPSYYKNNLIFCINLNFSKSNQKNFDFFEMLRLVVSDPADLRSLPTKARFSILKYVPHNLVTKLSRLRGSI
jgi:hypothetical protein